MPLYRVIVPELHYNHYEIRAESEEEAKEFASVSGKSIYVEFSHSLEENDDREWECSQITR